MWYFGQTFVIGLDLYIVSPLLPAISRQYDQPPGRVSLLVTGFALTYAASSPVWGLFSERCPRRVMALLSLTVFQIGDIMTALQPSFFWLTFSRAVTAAGAAGFTPALYAYIADTTPLQHRAGTMSVASAGFSTATFLGIPLGLMIANVWAWPAAFWLVFFLSLFSWFVTWRLWKPTRPPMYRHSNSICPDSRLAWNYGLTMLAFASFGSVYTYLPLDLTQHVHFSSGRLTWFMMAFGLFGLLGTLAAGYLSDRAGHVRVVRWGLLIEVVVLLGLLHPWTGGFLWAILLLFSMVTSYTPVLKALASFKGAKGLALSWNNAAMYVGLSAGSWGMASVWPLGMSAIYLGAAILATGAFILSLYLHV
ncbi:MAG: MFS transporter [Firmicutes bacterium]|nr:MFS transporter [Bacillota bacterium]MCL5012827.1 MFS transporter [Bacillota bacterium]